MNNILNYFIILASIIIFTLGCFFQFSEFKTHKEHEHKIRYLESRVRYTSDRVIELRFNMDHHNRLLEKYYFELSRKAKK